MRNSIDAKEVQSVWEDLRLTRKLRKVFPAAKLEGENIHLIKDSFKSSIWKVSLESSDHKAPIILKIIKPLSRERKESTVETKMYTRGYRVLHDLMPEIYHIQKEVQGQQIWVLMEYVKSLNEQIKFTPDHFKYIIPSLAQLHAQTYNERFHNHRRIFSKWMPQYESRRMEKERNKLKNKTLIIIDKAMETTKLNKLIKPNYKQLQKILHHGPHYFPQLLSAGQSITHNDLQTPNIGCSNVMNKTNWEIKFIDWEGAKFAPCWFDMVNLVGVFLGYRKDWRNEENAIVQRCVLQYTSEMKKHGVHFKEDPILLYKMAYLQRILEKGLYLQLSWEISGRKKAHLLEGYLEKINRWGKELKLY